MPDGRTGTSAQWLRDLTLEGAKQRYGEQVPSLVIQQIGKGCR